MEYYSDSTGFHVFKRPIITGDAGGITLSFSVREAEISKISHQSVIQVYSSGTRIYYGLVRKIVKNELQGCYDIVVWDIKKWLNEWPYFGASLQNNSTTRNLRTKYAYVKTEDSSNRLKAWTVGAIVQDVIHNANHDRNTDGLPVLTSLISEASEWDDGYTDWNSDIYTWALAGAWSDIDDAARRPWGHLFDNKTVGGVITQLMGRYYPAWSWWVPPDTLIPTPYKIYETGDSDDNDPESYSCGTASYRLMLSDVQEVLENCYTRVIIEGQNTAETAIGSSDTHAIGFVNPECPFVQRHTWDASFVRAGGMLSMNESEVYFEGIDNETYAYRKKGETKTFVVGLDPGSDPDDPAEVVMAAGSYGKDTRYVADTGFGGTAYTSRGIIRILTLSDDMLGSNVYVEQDGSDDPVFDDRSTVTDTIADEIHAMLRDVRYTGTLRAKIGGVIINPLQRVKVLSHPHYGTIEFVPDRYSLDLLTGIAVYNLGDQQYNPLSELQMVRELKWRDRDPVKNRPRVIK